MEGHCVIVVYDPALNTLEFMDSNNLPKQRARVHHAYFIYCEISNDIMRKVAAALPSVPIYINNHSIYSGYDYGVQSMEASSDKHTDSEREGFCLMWAIFLGDLALSFPDESMAAIIELSQKKIEIKTKQLGIRKRLFAPSDPRLCCSHYKQLEVAFDDETSKHQACVRLVKYPGNINLCGRIIVLISAKLILRGIGLFFFTNSVNSHLIMIKHSTYMPVFYRFNNTFMT
jgi:hypothetical protein